MSEQTGGDITGVHSILDDFGWLGAVHEETHIQTLG